MHIDWAKYERLYIDKVQMKLRVFKGNTFKQPMIKVYETFHNDKNAA